MIKIVFLGGMGDETEWGFSFWDGVFSFVRERSKTIQNSFALTGLRLTRYLIPKGFTLCYSFTPLQGFSSM
jgi:hypothetical protein